MRKFLLVIIAVLLCASFAEAWVYKTVGPQAKNNVVLNRLTGRAVVQLENADVSIGRHQLTFHKYTENTPPAGSAPPNTPLVLKMEVTKDQANNPPLTVNDKDFRFVVILVNSAGGTQIYGHNWKGVIPSNEFSFDLANGVWLNDKVSAYGNINTNYDAYYYISTKSDSASGKVTLRIR
jgi:hypothetical protein